MIELIEGRSEYDEVLLGDALGCVDRGRMMMGGRQGKRIERESRPEIRGGGYVAWKELSRNWPVLTS